MDRFSTSSPVDGLVGSLILLVHLRTQSYGDILSDKFLFEPRKKDET